MTFGKKTLCAIAALGASGFIAAAPQPASAASCGTDETVSIAEMTWLSAGTLAYVTEAILKDGYGCNAEVVPGDTVPTATTMLTKNDPQIAPELWVSTAQSIWDKIEEKGNVYAASDVFGNGGVEGWWIPDYVAKAHPDLKSVTDLPKFAKVFGTIEDPDVGRFYGCPPGWGCEIITNNLFKALDLENKGYELFSPGSGANLKASIARAVAREKPWVGYYWSPTAVIGKYNLVRLDMPAFDADKFACLTDTNCANPQLTGWKKGTVVVAVTKEFAEKAPEPAKFLEKMQVPNAAMNAVLAWGDDKSASPEETAEYFLKNHADIWSSWVPADVAEKVKAAL